LLPTEGAGGKRGGGRGGREGGREGGKEGRRKEVQHLHLLVQPPYLVGIARPVHLALTTLLLLKSFFDEREKVRVNLDLMVREGGREGGKEGGRG
jgi:hypothetical protein